VTLPGGLKTDKAEADFSDGILTLTFPKADEVKSKTIRIKTSNNK
jgi:HSP20 family molecular chaperone IbpA